ncbi:MAG: 6-carboxytetrahydropterin synthase QueD [Candidatus Margulisbacteria bacterium]|nr:6-carboxytetrahydropterin synthase QueD [Candidatus Margulisiibacteriota bacterium]
MYELNVEDKFAAAHQLVSYQGPCENLHGHTWKIKLKVKGNKLNETGMLMDFQDLKKILKKIRDRFDHQFLNDILKFSPTSENLAKYIFEQAAKQLPRHIQLAEVTVWESDITSATYYND